MNVKIEASWYEKLEKEFDKEYFNNLKQFLIEERKEYTVYPKGQNIFAAFDNCPFSETKVVILGQDPYHGPNQAHGLSFSVPDGIQPPPSLKNIFKELNQDIGIEIPNHGNLLNWAKQGVLLLNATLTVRASQAGSHRKQGWEVFTDEVIKILNKDKENLVFILWGRNAQDKTPLIDESKHLILKAAHPSPFSAYNGFFGCKHFSSCNEYLGKNSIKPIDWNL